MTNENYVALMIINYQEQIEHHMRQVVMLNQRIAELMCSDIGDSEGDITSYADWQ